MIFLDSNIFLHAFLKPRRMLTKDEKNVKDRAKAILERVEKGEEVAITTSHLSEVLNIIETGLGLQKSLGFLAWIITKENIAVYSVTIEHYEDVLPLAEEHNISINDGLACLFMKTHRLREIYSFDKHFDGIEDVVRISE